MSEFVLTLTNVSKSFDSKRVLDQVSLAIPPGSVVGLLGKNGTGKTTLIKCALGLLKPQSGEIQVFGEPAWTLSGAAKARIGYVPQTPRSIRGCACGRSSTTRRRFTRTGTTS